MKRNESILVYSVTGLLVVILGVAIAFGDGGVQAGSSLDLKTLEQLQGVVASKPADDPSGAGGSATTSTANAVDGSQVVEGGSPGNPVGPTKDAATPPAPALDAPLVAVAPPATDTATRVIVLLGESSRDGDYRVVSVRHGDTFSQLVQRWCGGVEKMDLAASLNEEFDLGRLEPGTRLYLPWVEDDVLLAAFERRRSGGGAATGTGLSGPRTADAGTVPAVHRAPGAGGVEDYTVKAGDMLWNIAVTRVGAGKANRFIEAVRDLNPDLRADPNRLSVGKTIRLPK